MFFIQFPKNYLILINTLANYFIRLFLNDVLFIMKLLWTNCEINIPDFSYNKSNKSNITIKAIINTDKTAAYLKCNLNIY